VKPKAWEALVAKYRVALAAYVEHGTEEHLARAYELGRTALNLGLGVMDIARLHQEALIKLVAVQPAIANAKWTKMVETFQMETLSAFEVAHRGFRDACDRLQRLNETLAERNRDLAASNRRLEQEVIERKNAQEALQESELKFRSVVETAQDGIITIDERGKLVAMNRSAEQMFGWKREELIGKPITRLIPKPLRAAAELTLKCLATGAEQQWFEHPVESVGLRHDGLEFSIELTLATWRTRGGMFFTGVVRDIRQRKQAEMALRESREHYIKLFQEAREMEENLRQLSNKVLIAQEEERKHISRELHDEIGQTLTAANVSVALLRQHAEKDPEFKKKCESAQMLLEQSMNMIHQFARELRPSMLDHLGPYAALQNYIKTFTERTGIKVGLESTIRSDALDVKQGTVLYRVAQESLTNVFKHAQATKVKIVLRQLPQAVCMEIADNGRASPPPDQLNGAVRGRLGLLGMQERVRLVNGEFQIESVPKRGTTVRVQIPLSPERVAEPTAATEHAPATSASN
jgi:PAS domain S-box-containing protein